MIGIRVIHDGVFTSPEEDLDHDRVVGLARSLTSKDYPNYHVYDDGTEAEVCCSGHIPFFITTDHILLCNGDPLNEEVAKRISSNYQSSYHKELPVRKVNTD